jgi:hypothetical protein
MKIILRAMIILFSTLSIPVYSGEIISKQFDSQGYLIVTYNPGISGRVKCTAFSRQGKRIGSDYAYKKRRVTKARIKVPEKYIGKKLNVSCKP